MERRELERFLHEHIPLSQAMGVQVRKSIAGKFIASSSLGYLSAWTRFQEMLKRKRRARISIEVTIRCKGETVGEINGDFVAVASPAG